jgi:hypothetical protein
MAGVPLTVAQRLMRHSDPKLTSNLYTDVRVLDLHGAVEAMAPIAPTVVARVVAKVVPTSGTPSHSEPTDVNKRTVGKKSRKVS